MLWGLFLTKSAYIVQEEFKKKNNYVAHSSSPGALIDKDSRVLEEDLEHGLPGVWGRSKIFLCTFYPAITNGIKEKMDGLEHKMCCLSVG